jgi:hypothetical protein
MKKEKTEAGNYNIDQLTYTKSEFHITIAKYAFWDVKPEYLDVLKEKVFIISRMFERGKFEDVLSVIIFYRREETTKVLQENKYLNRKGLFLAHALLEIPLQDFKAYSTFKPHCAFNFQKKS